MFTTAAQLLGTAATAYGVLAALTTPLQARQMLERGTSCEVSGRFFASYAGGDAIWLGYGLSTGNLHRSRPNPRPAAHPGPESRLGWRRRPAPAQRTGDRRAADAGPDRVRQRSNDPAGLPGAEPA
jgi:hypothetical protein